MSCSPSFILYYLKNINSYGSGQVFDNAVLDSKCKGSSFRLSKENFPFYMTFSKICLKQIMFIRDLYKAKVLFVKYFVKNCFFKVYCVQLLAVLSQSSPVV